MSRKSKVTAQASGRATRIAVVHPHESIPKERVPALRVHLNEIERSLQSTLGTLTRMNERRTGNIPPVAAKEPVADDTSYDATIGNIKDLAEKVAEQTAALGEFV